MYECAPGLRTGTRRSSVEDAVGSHRMRTRPTILRRWFPLTVTVVSLLAVLEFWISLKLRINPACGANVPHWVPLWLNVVLLCLAIPGWFGSTLLYRVLPEQAFLAAAFVTQFLVYFGLGHLVALGIRAITGRRRRKEPEVEQ